MKAREWFYGPKSWINVDNPVKNEPDSTFAESRDIIHIHIVLLGKLQEPILRFFGATGQENGDDSVLRSEIAHSLTVRHRKRHDDPLFDGEYLYRPSERDLPIRSSPVNTPRLRTE